MIKELIHIDKVDGLNEKDIPLLQQQYGKNKINIEKTNRIIVVLKETIKDPMILLLLLACILYLVLGKFSEGILTIVAFFLVMLISIYQVMRSDRALEALKQYNSPGSMVVRDGQKKRIPSEDLVPGDIIVLAEGNKVPADAFLIRGNDFSVDESLITGEAFPVSKSEVPGENQLYQGSTVNSGQGFAKVTATGGQTVFGQLSTFISEHIEPETTLQKQVARQVRMLAIIGLIAFAIIWLINYLHSGQLIESLLFGLTLALAAIPEEIPVAFTSFMALGAYRMGQQGIITRHSKVLENLGAVSVICLDKTGTITENNMTVTTIYDFDKNKLMSVDESSESQVLYYAMLASEINPFDSMEMAIHTAYYNNCPHPSLQELTQTHEYPLNGIPPMMTHVFRYGNHSVVAGKGAAEKVIQVCKLSDAALKEISGHISNLATKGYRILGVCSAIANGELPVNQEDFNWKFEGLLFFYDPPKENIQRVMTDLYSAHIDIKVLTGDFTETTLNIAKEAGIRCEKQHYTGSQIMAMDEKQVEQAISQASIFSRMFPDAKLKVIRALKSMGHVVAMTGDGVNDAPALKEADIGIAMGMKGTETARQSADLVITDDNLEKVVDAIRQGRKIFVNLKKSIRYIISIHIPIILTATVPLLLGWKFSNIFTPVHVIFLELIMGPTCSIFFEQEPVESSVMKASPRPSHGAFFRGRELLLSVLQGVVISFGVLWIYYSSMKNNQGLETTRTLVFTTLLISNIFLTLADRSFTENISKTIRYQNKLLLPVIFSTVSFLVVIHIIPSLRQVFGLVPLQTSQWLLCIGVSAVCVFWFELYKVIKGFSSTNG